MFTLNIKRISLIMLICISSLHGLGQNIITLNKAVERARENYPGIKASKLAIDQSQAMKKTAWDLGNTQIFSGKEEAGSGQDGVTTVIGIQQQQIDIFGIGPKMKLTDQRTMLSEMKHALSLLELDKVVKTCWAHAFAARKQYQIYVAMDSIFAKLEQAASIKLETEDISKLQWLSIKNEARQVKISKKQVLHDYKTSLANLNRWLGLDTMFDVSDELPESVLPLFASSDSIADHPALSYHKQQIRVAKAQTALAKSDFLPQLNAQYGMQKIAGETGFYSYQFGLRIPLFFSPQAGRAQSAKIEEKIVSQHFSQKQQDFKANYTAMVEQYKKWQTSWTYYKDEAFAMATEQQRGALTAFREGAIEYIVFLQHVRDALNIKQHGWQALEKMLISQYNLEYYLQNN